VIEERGNATVVWQQGPRHKYYEDRYRLLCRPIPFVEQADRGEIFAVCDGVGSAPRGRDAAQEVCDVLVKFYENAKELSPTAETLIALLDQANSVIHAWGLIEGTDRTQGASAATVVWITDDLVVNVFHVGDTSALLIRNGTAQALTSAHHDAVGHLTNYFGRPSLQIEIKTIQLDIGDRLLLLSDGISKSLYNQKIANIVESHSRRSASLEALLSAARNAGSGDDVTAVLVDIEEKWLL
jgi:serine/threonine protein phosphatase PrpC